MRVGILSMQRVVNFGSFMQALSLKQMVENLGHEAVFLDFHRDIDINKKNNIKEQIKFRLRASRIWAKLRKALKGPVVNTPNEIEKKYIDCYPLLGLTPEKKYNTPVDVLIIGSDEVFNCLQIGANVGYSLELFGKKNRAKRLISYAASFGSTTEEKLKYYHVDKEVAKYLCKFDSISVRDENSYNIVKSLCAVEPEVHLDPVLVGMIEKQEFRNINKKNFVAVYGYGNRFTQEEGKAIQEFAHKRGLTTVAVYGVQQFCDEHIVCRPDEIMSYFKNADYVVTDTFHGTIFSVITHKKFAVFGRCGKEKGVTNQEKLDDLLKRLELTDKRVDNLENLEQVLELPVDFSKLDTFRAKEREKTLKYLEDNII